MSDESTGTFRVAGKHFFLTYARCPVELEYAVSFFIANFGGALSGCTVARELHQDGCQHLHVCLSFDVRKDYRNPRIFDMEFEGLAFHPNVQVARSVQHVLRYVTKYGEFIKEGTHLQVSVARSGSATAEVAKRALSGEPLLALCNENPGVFMLHKKRLEELVLWHGEQTALTNLIEKASSIPSRLQSVSIDQVASLSPSEREIFLWLVENIRSEPRAFKQKQLYLWGPPNSGKSSLLSLLMIHLPTYVMPTEDFYDLFDPKLHRLVILDEFRAQKTIQFLNQWADGQVMSIRKKGSQGLKSVNLPLIICSNFSIREAYSKSDEAHLESLICRFNAVHVEKIFNLIDLLKELFE